MHGIPRSSVDIVMAGFILFMVYARARHSDAQHVCTLVFDLDSRGNLPAGFIDAEVKKTKTSYTTAEDQVSADVSPGARPQWKVLGIRLESRS